jgi:hypothetical protein
VEADSGVRIVCRCGALIFDGLILKGVSVAQFAGGRANLKCKGCKFWMEGIDARIFLEVPLVFDFRDKRGA